MNERQTSTSANIIYALFAGFIRLVVIGYGVLAVFSFFEIRSLLQNSKSGDSFKIEDGTLFVPLVLCFPSTLDVDGITIMDTVNVTSSAFVEQHVECRQLDYLMSSCASSLLFALCGCAIFVLCDCLAHIPWCPFDKNSSSSMAILLSFLLGQAGISIGALAEQNHYWVAYFKDVVDDRKLDLDVQSYANSVFLIAATLTSFAVAVLLLIDATCSHCCRQQQNVQTRPEEKEEQTNAKLGWLRQSKDIEDASQMNGVSKVSIPLDDDEGGSTIAPSSAQSYTATPPWSKV